MFINEVVERVGKLTKLTEVAKVTDSEGALVSLKKLEVAIVMLVTEQLAPSLVRPCD